MTMTNRCGDGISLSFTCDYDSHFLPHVKLHDVSLFVPIWQFDEMYINPIPLGSVSFLLLSTLLTQTHTFEQCRHKIDFKLSNSISLPIRSVPWLSSKFQMSTQLLVNGLAHGVHVVLLPVWMKNVPRLLSTLESLLTSWMVVKRILRYVYALSMINAWYSWSVIVAWTHDARDWARSSLQDAWYSWYQQGRIAWTYHGKGK